MTFAALAPPSPAATRSLPPLSGRLLHVYRLLWWALTLGALATLASLALSPVMDPLVVGLRLTKGAVLVTVSALLFRRRQQDAVAALLSLAFLIWTVTSSFDVTGGRAPASVAIADRLRFLLFALALLLFPGGRWWPSWIRGIAAAAAGVFMLGIAEILGLLPTRLFLPLAILCVLGSIGALLWRFRFGSSAAERQQLKWVALGLTTGILLILAARAGAALNGVGGSIRFAPPLLEALFQLGIIAIAIGFLVSLLRYRLYDAETVISRSAAYAALTLALVATFTASEVFIEGLGQNYLGAEIGNLAGALAAGVAAMLLAPLHERVTAWAERHFQRDLAALKQQLPELLTQLAGTASPARIGAAALPRIAEAVHARDAALIIDGEVLAATGIGTEAVASWAARCLPEGPELATGSHCQAGGPFSLRLPLHCPFGSLRGWLLLGPRPDGSRHASDDLEALRAVSGPLRIALFAAREREMEKQLEEAAQQRIQRRLDRVARRLAALEKRSAAVR
jgi:hypothetical protein